MAARLLLLLLLVVALVALRPDPAGADATITVGRSEATVSFPGAVSFRLEAESAAEITGVTLLATTPGRRYGGALHNFRPTFTPGPRVAASYTWRRFGSALPPGTEITYRWRITAADGSTTETPAASVRVDDGRFPWRELRDGAITVRWHKGDDRFGRDLLAAATESIAELGKVQGIELRYPLTIHNYASQQELYEAIPGAPAWIGGVAIPEFDTLITGIPPGRLSGEGRRVLAHEITHQLVYQMTAHPTLGSVVPTWLNEGLAVVAEGPTQRQNQRLIDDAVDDDALPTLRNLAAPFSARDGHLAGLAYAAAESAVRYLLDEHGADTMRALLRALGEGRPADEAARQAYGRSLDQLEDGWRASLGLTPYDRSDPAAPNAVPDQFESAQNRALERTTLLWLALGLLALVAVVSVAGGWLVVRRLR